MNTFSPSRALRLAALGTALALAGAAPAEDPAPSAPWTESDSRLANHYIQLLQKDPAYGKVLDLLWDLYGKKGQTALLLDYFKGASESGPAVAKLLYAHLLRKGGDAEAARPLYDEILESEPENVPALKALAEIADQQRRWAEALALHARLAGLLPADDEEGLAIRLRKAALHRLQSETEAAVADWNALLKSFPGKASLRAEIVGLLLEAGETETASTVLRELAETGDPRRRLDALLELNRLHEFTDDFDGAVATAREAMGSLHFESAEYAELLSRLVRIHERHDRLDELEEALAEAATGEHPAERALRDLAEFHRLTADPAKEEAVVARLVGRLPGDPGHRIRLAELQMRNDRYAAAAATLDALLEAEAAPPLDLVLRRALVDLHAEGREAASARLAARLDAGGVAAAGRRSILDFARTHYLDDLVERLLGDPALVSGDSPEEASSALELARFLHERGRADQAAATLRRYVSAESTPHAKADRLHQAGIVFKELGMAEESLAALDEAISLAPSNLDYQSSRVDLYVSTKAIGKALAALEAIREAGEGLEARAETDQRIFSLIRGHYATAAETQDDSVLKQGEIRSLAEYRRLAAAASRAASRGGGGDEPPPRELTDYYESIKRAADGTPSTERRYRAAWWALKLQDNQECYRQLTLANEEAGRPVVEVERMLLRLAEQNERTTLMVRHLTTLIEIDPERADDYRQRRAEMRFELGDEDVAMRELKALADRPGAPLATLATLAKLYQRQGSPGKQVEVWRRAYREADLFGKRSIAKQLSNALVEAGHPEEALNVQVDLLERETDPIQRRKQLDGQITVAQAHRLLDWMRERYAELAGRHPFDRFYPEALARVHHAAGDDREAYEAMKKAYYMSGRSEELLSELGALSGKLGDLKSAIYYRRQLLARGEGDTLDNWKELVRMLEKDLRVGEADQLRRRLETKFGSDVDFLAELSDHHLKAGSPRDAERVLSRLVALRDWDPDARFRLGLLQARRGEDEAAFATFSAVLEGTEGAAYPEGFDGRRLPLIRAGGDGTLGAFVFTVEAYPFIDGNLQEEIAEALEQPHPEFDPSPKERHLLRLRAIEEAAVLAARLGRSSAWLAQWDNESRPLVERLWATRHAGAGGAFAALLERRPDSASHIDRLLHAYCLLLAGDAKGLLAWTEEENAADGTPHPRSLYAAMAALLLLKDNAADPALRAETVYETLAGLAVPRTIAAHHFSELRKAGRFEEAYRAGEIFAADGLAEEPSFLYGLSQVAGLSGRRAERELWLDRSLDPGLARSGRRLAGHYDAALTEKLALLDSDVERAAFLGELAAHTDFAALGDREAADRALILALAAGDVGGAAACLKRFVEVERGATLPASHFVAEHERSQSWQRLARLLHRCADRLRLDREGAAAFADALGGKPLVDRSLAEVSAQYEQFEIDRALLLLETIDVPERDAFLRALRGLLREPDSRAELAKSLESRGFHREAVPVYLDDAAKRDRDYAPLQGLFEAAAEALDPAPALAVIAQINTREFPAPPGLTVDYLNEQHARFLLMDRDFERLAQLGRQPEARAGAPPVMSRSHLPYQDALVEGYRRAGEDEALLRLLSDLRRRGGISGVQTLLGVETLARADRHEEALEWASSIALSPSSETTLQRRALQLALASHAALAWKDVPALRELALAGFGRQPAAAIRNLADALRRAGAPEEASSLLKLLRRDTSDAVQRSATAAELLFVERGRGTAWTELSDELEGYFLDFAYQADSAETDPDGAAPPAPVRSNAFRFVEAALADAEAAELGEALGSLSVPRENRWLANLLAAHFQGRLEAEARAELADLGLASAEAARVLETLPAFGAPGIAAARAVVEESGRPGDAFFPNEPARQIAFFHRLGDRPRLVEVHARLVRESRSDAFRQSGMEDWVATLDTRRDLPPLFAAIGETELAGSLFRAYDRAISSYQWNHLGFLNDYAAFLVGSGAHAEAEALLKRILRKSLRIDLRLLPRLYAAAGLAGEWEARVRDLHLTRGQEVLLRDWMDALAEGRELREVRDSW